MALIASLGLRPTQRMLALAGAADGPEVAGLLPDLAAPAQAAPGVKGGAEVELVTREFPARRTRYGELKVSATLKLQALGGSGEGDGGFTGMVTSKDKSGGRTPGIKKTFGYADIADRELFAGFELKDFSVAFENEISGLDITVAGLVKFTLVTNAFQAKAQTKLTLLNIKGAKEIAGPALEIKVAPVEFQRRLGGVQTKVLAEYKASFTVDAKKVGAEVGKQVIEKLAKETLEKEAKKAGVRVLGRQAAEKVLQRLGPLAAAFGVGLEIGELLNKYSAAPQAAKFVIDEILGDLAERYHEKDTLGKMWLISKNSPRILAALVAGGVIGTVAGVGDLVLFKLFGLDKLGDYAQALKAFGAGLTELATVARVPADAFAGALAYTGMVLGIKFNPKHAILAHGALEPLFAGVFRRIRPMYAAGKAMQVSSVRLQDAAPDPAALLKFATYAHGFRMNWQGRIDLASPQSVAGSLRGLALPEFVAFLETNRLVRYDVSFPASMDPDEIDEKLLDELA